ncbi:MAG: hypothetical protein AAF655_09960 [Bacteroidota bacterium]
MDKIYKPIACGLYDQLELWAMRKNDVTITYITTSGPITTTDRIKDLTQINKAECMVLESDSSTIRLDDIISVNGIPFDQADACKVG